MKTKSEEGIKVITQNRRARHDYDLLELFEAGLVLTGTEIKSIRDHQISLQNSYVTVRNGEMWWIDANISPYVHGNRENHDPTRPRKLLLHRREIGKIAGLVKTKGITLIPVRVYLKKGRAKLEFSIARGKKLYDKRQDMAERDSKRQIERALREKYR